MRTRGYFFTAIVLFVLCLVRVPVAQATTIAEQQAALQAQLDQVNTQITQNQKQLNVLQNQRASLERDVGIIDAQIAVAKLQIKQRDLTIAGLRDQVKRSQKGIDSLDASVASGEESIAQMIRETNEVDRTAFIEILLNDSLSDALSDANDFATLQRELNTAFTTMATQRSDLSARKQALEDEYQQESDLLSAQKAQAASLQASEKQKQAIVTAAKGQESIYLQVIEIGRAHV